MSRELLTPLGDEDVGGAVVVAREEGPVRHDDHIGLESDEDEEAYDIEGEGGFDATEFELCSEGGENEEHGAEVRRQEEEGDSRAYDSIPSS